jgi:putative ABC transport system permease protein
MANAIGVDMRLALRNTVRQRRRSALALAAIGCGVAALMLAAGFIDWNFLHYREAMIRSQFGHLQIHRAGFGERGAADPFAFLLPGRSDALTALGRLPGVRAVAPRLALSGLASHGEATVPFIAEGVDVDVEAAMTGALKITSGAPLAAGDAEGVLLGQGLAATLGAAPGSRLVLLVTTPRGGVNAGEVTVRGVFSTISKAYDDAAVRMPIAASRQLLRVDGSHTWVLQLTDTERTPSLLPSVQALLGERYEVVPWWQLSDFYNKSAELFAKQVAVMKVIIGLLIVLSITTTLTMTVMERTGEIGTVMALGDTPAVVLRRFLVEGLVLGALGALLGAALGWVLAAIVSSIGIPVPPPPGMAEGYVGGILVTTARTLDAVALAVGTTLLASAYPAWRASRMQIVDALRSNRA